MTAAGFHRVSRLGGHTQQHLDCHDTQRCAYIFRGDPQKEHFASKEPKQMAVTQSPLQFNPGGWLLVAGGMGRSRIQTLVCLKTHNWLISPQNQLCFAYLVLFYLDKKKRHFTCVFQCPKSDASTFK